MTEIVAFVKRSKLTLKFLLLMILLMSFSRFPFRFSSLEIDFFPLFVMIFIFNFNVMQARLKNKNVFFLSFGFLFILLLESFYCCFGLYERQQSTSAFTSRQFVSFSFSFSFFSFENRWIYILLDELLNFYYCSFWIEKTKYRRPAIVRIDYLIKMVALAIFGSRFFFIILSNEFYLFNAECNCHSLICKSSMEKPVKRMRKILYSVRSPYTDDLL